MRGFREEQRKRAKEKQHKRDQRDEAAQEEQRKRDEEHRLEMREMYERIEKRRRTCTSPFSPTPSANYNDLKKENNIAVEQFWLVGGDCNRIVSAFTAAPPDMGTPEEEVHNYLATNLDLLSRNCGLRVEDTSKAAYLDDTRKRDFSVFERAAPLTQLHVVSVLDAKPRRSIGRFNPDEKEENYWLQRRRAQGAAVAAARVLRALRRLLHSVLQDCAPGKGRGARVRRDGRGRRSQGTSRVRAPMLVVCRVCRRVGLQLAIGDV
jgi:hypothetical protein